MNSYSNKTVLITGATGLLGSHLVNRFIKMGDVRIVALSRNQLKLETIFKSYLDNEMFSIIAQDVTMPLPEFEYSIDYIFHAASPISGTIIKQKPVDVIIPNILGTKNYLDFLLAQRKKMGISGRIVLFSSATVYSNTMEEDRIVTEEETSMSDILDAPNAPYSESKRLIEVLAKAYFKQFNVDSVIARFSYLYGYTYYQTDTAFYEFINKAINGEDIILNNSDIARRDNIYIDDAIEGLLYLTTFGKSAESYNISSGGELNNFMAVDEIAAIIAQNINETQGKSVRIRYLNKNENKRRPGVILNNTKIKKFGWNVKCSMEQGINSTIRDYIAHMKG